MIIEIPIYLAEITAVEGINGSDFVENALINTAMITKVFPNTDGGCVINLSGDEPCVTTLSMQEVYSLINSYEISMYKS